LLLCILFDAVITELARSTKAFAELGGRTHPLIADVVVALVEMGRWYFHNFLVYISLFTVSKHFWFLCCCTFFDDCLVCVEGLNVDSIAAYGRRISKIRIIPRKFCGL